MERIERGGEDDRPHDRIEERAENHCQLPDEQDKDAEECDGKKLSAIHESVGLLKTCEKTSSCRDDGVLRRPAL